jgi:hypothetical protein
VQEPNFECKREPLRICCTCILQKGTVKVLKGDVLYVSSHFGDPEIKGNNKDLKFCSYNFFYNYAKRGGVRERERKRGRETLKEGGQGACLPRDQGNRYIQYIVSNILYSIGTCISSRFLVTVLDDQHSQVCFGRLPTRDVSLHVQLCSEYTSSFRPHTLLAQGLILW